MEDRAKNIKWILNSMNRGSSNHDSIWCRREGSGTKDAQQQNQMNSKNQCNIHHAQNKKKMSKINMNDQNKKKCTNKDQVRTYHNRGHKKENANVDHKKEKDNFDMKQGDGHPLRDNTIQMGNKK